jgi:poly(A) polymerase
VAAADYQQAAATMLPDLRRHLDVVMMAEDAEAGLDALLDCGALSALLPEVEQMVGFGDGEWRHKDVWKHTKQVVCQAVPRLEVRWAALLHDIGKVKTRTISPDGQVHFFGHAEVGARMFDKMQRRVPLFSDDDSFRKSVRFLILHHLRASQYDTAWTDSAVRRFAREMGQHMGDLFCLSRADITTKRREKKRRGLAQIDQLSQRVTRLASLDQKKSQLPKGLGTEIMRHFDVPPSKRLGDIKRNLETAVDAGHIEGDLDAESYIRFLEANSYLIDP